MLLIVHDGTSQKLKALENAFRRSRNARPLSTFFDHFSIIRTRKSVSSPCPRYMLGGELTMFLVKKEYVKQTIALMAQFSNVNLDLLY